MTPIGFLYWFFWAVHLIICAFLIGIVLIQGGKGASLSASFGMGSSSAFGPQTDTFMIKWTRNIAIAFLVTSIGLAKLSVYKPALTTMRTPGEETTAPDQKPAITPGVEASPEIGAPAILPASDTATAPPAAKP